MSKLKPIRLGLVGIGRAGWGMHCTELEALKDYFQIVAACDVDPERTGRMAARYGCRIYDRVEDLVRDPEVEVVDVASPSPCHVPHALLALRAGKHVIQEKPIGLNYAEARKLATAQAKSTGRVFCRHNRRFEAAFQHVREIVASGLLGEMFEVRLRGGGYGRRNDWQTVRAQGGGMLLNWGPHLVDQALVLLDSPVADLWSDLKNVASLGDAEDCAHVILRGENGRVVDVMVGGAMGISVPSLTIFGSKGALVYDGKGIRVRYLDPKHKLPARRLVPGTPPPGSGFNYPDDLKWVDETLPVAPKLECNDSTLWRCMYDSIRKGKPYPVPLEHALEVMRVITRAKKGTKFEVKA
jgi:predicted dehydrogenase